MDTEIMSIDMNDTTNDAIGFTWAVDSAIWSRSPSNLGSSRVHSFAWAVESAIWSRSPSNFGSSPVHSFAWKVDSAIWSRTPSPSNWGTSPVHSFASVVDTAIRSRTASDLGTSPPLCSFASLVGNIIGEGFQIFTLAELVAATNGFSLESKIGAGSFGVMYRGKLFDGSEVAIKRCEMWSKGTSSFMSELAFFSRLHHKHLVEIVGFCQEKDERLLVYEYLENGTLYDRLHDKRRNVLNSWKMRIKVALDASRGIQHLHRYAVPSIVHRDIKSSNIFLDATWRASARVCGFGLSLMSPEPDYNYRLMKALGAVGHIDPEYCGLNELTAKTDVHGLGVVLFELLTGKRPIFKHGEEGSTSLLSVVDFALPQSVV